MAEVLNDAAKIFVIHGVRDNVRNDGRGRSDYRPMELETDIVSNTNGSARIRLANTDVLVGVKAEIGSPLPGKPQEGRMDFFTDCSANATPEFEGRGGEELATEVTMSLSRAYASAAMFDLRTMCIIPGQQCWILYVDVVILEYGGNLLDAASLAVKAALFSTRIPKVTVNISDGAVPELDVSDDPFDVVRLDVSNSPCVVTLTQVGGSYVVDASLEEEACSHASLVIATTKEGLISHTRKAGGGSLHPETVIEMLETGREVGMLLDKVLMKRLKEEEALGPHRMRRGFLG